MSVEGEFNSSLVVSVSWGPQVMLSTSDLRPSINDKIKKNIYILNRDMESDEKKTWKGKK